MFMHIHFKFKGMLDSTIFIQHNSGNGVKVKGCTFGGSNFRSKFLSLNSIAGSVWKGFVSQGIKQAVNEVVSPLKKW